MSAFIHFLYAKPVCTSPIKKHLLRSRCERINCWSSPSCYVHAVTSLDCFCFVVSYSSPSGEVCLFLKLSSCRGCLGFPCYHLILCNIQSTWRWKKRLSLMNSDASCGSPTCGCSSWLDFGTRLTSSDCWAPRSWLWALAAACHELPHSSQTRFGWTSRFRRYGFRGISSLFSSSIQHENLTWGLAR